MSEPDWTNIDSTKRWLEQSYTGSAEAGSPLYQYLLTLGRNTKRRESHLITYELVKWMSVNQVDDSVRYPPPSQTTVFYPEYQPAFLSEGVYKPYNEDIRKSNVAVDKSNRQKQRSIKARIHHLESTPIPKTTEKKDVVPKVVAQTTKRRSKGIKQGKPEAPRQERAQKRPLRRRVGSGKERATSKS